MRQICYFCTTPYQLMTIINIQMTVNAEKIADLFIIDQFSNADDVVCKIKNTNLFNRTILIHENDVYKTGENSKIRIFYQEFRAYINIKNIMRTILKEAFEVRYDSMYLSSKTFIGRLSATYFVERYNTNIIYFDDGLGSYFSENTFKPAFIDRIMRRLLFGRNAKKIEPSIVLLYSPKLFNDAGVNCKNNLKVERIPKWTCNNKFKEVINYVFSYSSNNSIKESIIIFDSFYKGREREQLDNFYKEVFKLAGKENVIIKKHPRDKKEGIAGIKYYRYPYFPFEVICLNNEMGNKLLISVNSTAVITPVLLLNQEPSILVINNIPGLTNNHVNAQYDKFRDMYTNKDKIYEADSIENALKHVQEYCEESLN